MRTDVLLLVPLQPATGNLMDATYRRTLGAHQALPLLAASRALELELGRPLSIEGARFDGEVIEAPAHRSLSAVALATPLERAGLGWHAIDPGARELGYWRARLSALAATRPRVVGICTTFLMSRPWAQALCGLVRRAFPEATVVLGGYYYATDARAFLSLDADVYCVGEGEVRIVQIVERLGRGEPLDDVPGLYLRDASRSLRYTGDAAALDLGALPAPDWDLAERIEPAVDLRRDRLDVPVETQRGCVFKCEYCTYRTLAELSVMPAIDAADRILTTGPAARGWINLVDATGTFPRDRWSAVLDRLIAQGGSPRPVGAFARVSDISPEIATKMAAANVRFVFIGQESGDQQMLNAMRKGTRADSVAPAVAALGRAGVDAYLSFLLGFPGETERSIEATRAMILDLNRGFERRPACLLYAVQPYSRFDLAASGGDGGRGHWLGWTHGKIDASRIAEEMLQTLVATSVDEAAPVNAEVIGIVQLAPGSVAPLLAHRRRTALFRWLKAVERGVATFLVRELEGTPPNPRELRRVRAEILDAYAKRPMWPRREVLSPTFGVGRRAQRAAARGLAREWRDEGERGVGLLTRIALCAAAGRDGGARAAARTLSQARSTTTACDPRVDVLAGELVRRTIDGARRRQ